MRPRSNWEFGVTQETNDNVSDGQHRFTLLYDGECPLCRREIEWFCRRDPESMHVVDISVKGFDSNAYGLAQDDVHRELHGIKPDGTVTVGVHGVVHCLLAIPSNHRLDVPTIRGEPAEDWHLAGEGKLRRKQLSAPLKPPQSLNST